MRRVFSGVLASALALSAGVALAQTKPPLKLGGILDMSGLYADITGAGSEAAAKMAVEDFGGEVLGRKVEIVVADHLNKADVSASLARDMLDNQGVEMIFDVAASATALAAGEIAKARNKLIIFNGPATVALTNEACGPYTVHYTYDTYGQANVTGLAAVKSGLDTWFFLTADYAFGQALERDTTNVVVKNGGKVLGSVRHPLNTSDFSSFLLQAQASKAKVIGLANAGGDTINAIKQAAEFGLMKGGQKASPLLVFITDIDSIGLEIAQNLLLSEAFYWDLNDETRAFSKRFTGTQEAAADHCPGRRVFLGLALSEGGEGRRHHRRGGCDQDDEGDADQRHVRQKRKDPRRRPHGARHVPVRGQEAVGIQGALGLLQAGRHGFRQRCIPAVGSVALPAGEEVTAIVVPANAGTHTPRPIG